MEEKINVFVRNKDNKRYSFIAFKTNDILSLKRSLSKSFGGVPEDYSTCLNKEYLHNNVKLGEIKMSQLNPILFFTYNDYESLDSEIKPEKMPFLPVSASIKADEELKKLIQKQAELLRKKTEEKKKKEIEEKEEEERRKKKLEEEKKQKEQELIRIEEDRIKREEERKQIEEIRKKQEEERKIQEKERRIKLEMMKRQMEEDFRRRIEEESRQKQINEIMAIRLEEQKKTEEEMKMRKEQEEKQNSISEFLSHGQQKNETDLMKLATEMHKISFRTRQQPLPPVNVTAKAKETPKTINPFLMLDQFQVNSKQEQQKEKGILVPSFFSPPSTFFQFPIAAATKELSSTQQKQTSLTTKHTKTRHKSSHKKRRYSSSSDEDDEDDKTHSTAVKPTQFVTRRKEKAKEEQNKAVVEEVLPPVAVEEPLDIDNKIEFIVNAGYPYEYAKSILEVTNYDVQQALESLTTGRLPNDEQEEDADQNVKEKKIEDEFVYDQEDDIPSKSNPLSKMTPEERKVIKRLMGLGFNQETVLQVYEACDKIEDVAMNCLISLK